MKPRKLEAELALAGLGTHVLFHFCTTAMRLTSPGFTASPKPVLTSCMIRVAHGAASGHPHRLRECGSGRLRNGCAE